MARRALLVAALLAVGVTLAWWTGAFGPAADPVAEVGDDGAAPDPVAAPGAGEAAALAGGRAGPRAKVVGPGGARTPPPATGAPRVTGRVVDPAGAPVGGARVVTMAENLGGPIGLEDLGADGVGAFDAVTGSDGRFVVGVAPDVPTHALVALTATFATATLAAVRAGDDVTVTVDPPGEVAGVVTDLQGEPVVGATVTWATFLESWVVETVATSGAGGAYRLTPVPSVGAYLARARLSVRLRVEARGFAPLWLVPPPPEPGSTRELHLVLTRGQTVIGKVVDADTEAPVPGARVVAWGPEHRAERTRPRGASPLARWEDSRYAEAVTDAAGAFRLEHVPCRGFHPVTPVATGDGGPFVAWVAAVVDGACSTTQEVPLRDEGATVEVALILHGAVTLTGRVVGTDGQPLASVAMSVVVPGRAPGWLPEALARDDEPPARATTDVDGRYVLVRVPVSRTHEEAVKVVGRVGSRWSGPSRRWSEDGDGAVSVQARAGAPVAVPDLVVKAPDAGTPRTVRVRVLRPDGAPAWGAMVSGVGSAPIGAADRTDRDGWITLAFRPPTPRAASGPQTVRATLAGFAPVDGSVTPTVEAGEPVTLMLNVGRRLAGRVTGPDGAAAKGATVQVADATLPLAETFPEPVPRVRDRAPRLSRVRTRRLGFATADADGRFTVDDLPEGPYHLLVITGATIPGVVVPPRATVGDVPTGATDLRIVLPAAGTVPTGRLVGAVRDQAGGPPLVRMSVAVRRDGTTIATATSGADSGEDGRAVGGGAVPSPGRFDFPTLPAGPVTLRIGAPQYVARFVDVVVRAGETTEVPTVNLSRGITVRGRLHGHGMNVPGGTRSLAFAPLDAPEGGAWRTVEVDADGAYEAGGFGPGRYRVAVWVHDARDEVPVTVPGDGHVLVLPEQADVVTFEPTLIVAGILRVACADDRLPVGAGSGDVDGTDEQRRFAAGCRVVVTNAAGAVVAEQTGGFARGQPGPVGFVPLPPGTYTVRIEVPGEPASVRPVTLVAGEQVEVAFGRPAPPK